jgi:hypothetical protein
MLSSEKDPKSPYPADLAGWLELDYHRRLRPLRGRRKWFTLGALAVTVAGLVWTFLPGGRAAHEAGPVSTAHAMFNNDCGRCHTESWKPVERVAFGDSVRSVPDAACRVCHDAGPHHKGEAVAFDCAACHREHRGKESLARVADGHCTACHADLGRAVPGAAPHPPVTSFAGDHPDFGPSKPGTKDRTKLHFNHAYHLGLDLKALRARGRPVPKEPPERLECGSCHQPDSARRYMQPVSYQRHCQQCHPLQVAVAGHFEDPETRKAAAAFRQVPALHAEPSLVQADLRERFLRFAREHPVVLGTPPTAPPRRPLPGRDPAAVTEAEWVWAKAQLTAAAEVLFTNRQLPVADRAVFDAGAGCAHCHEAKPGLGPDGLPQYNPTDVPNRWLTHATFDHDSHRMLQCVACHAQALKSEHTSDVLLPSRDDCRRCHIPTAGARRDCAECHHYHDRGRERGLNGLLTLDAATSTKGRPNSHP